MRDTAETTFVFFIFIVIVFVLLIWVFTKVQTNFDDDDFRKQAQVVCSEDGVSYLVVDKYREFGITVMLEDGPNGLQLKRCTPSPKE